MRISESGLDPVCGRTVELYDGCGADDDIDYVLTFGAKVIFTQTGVKENLYFRVYVKQCRLVSYTMSRILGMTWDKKGVRIDDTMSCGDTLWDDIRLERLYLVKNYVRKILRDVLNARPMSYSEIRLFNCKTKDDFLICE